eukprot:2630784-Amphidinium_carterae.1
MVDERMCQEDWIVIDTGSGVTKYQNGAAWTQSKVGGRHWHNNGGSRDQVGGLRVGNRDATEGQVPNQQRDQATDLRSPRADLRRAVFELRVPPKGQPHLIAPNSRVIPLVMHREVLWLRAQRISHQPIADSDSDSSAINSVIYADEDGYYTTGSGKVRRGGLGDGALLDISGEARAAKSKQIPIMPDEAERHKHRLGSGGPPLQTRSHKR